MATSILWKGISSPSLENCRIQATEYGYAIRSMIIGLHEEQIFQVEYEIRTDVHWQNFFVRVSSDINKKTVSTLLEKKEGQWFLNDRPAPQFKSASFVDISLTPFTNTLPVRSLEWTKDPQIIDVIYFDLPAGEVKPVQQLYKQLDRNHFLFATADDSFQSTLTVYSEGFVTDYPTLFRMMAKQEMADNL